MKLIILLTALAALGHSQEQQEPLTKPSRCQQEPDPGSCGEYNVRWFFNPKVGKCLRFLYRGCGGNQNNFEEEEECNSLCKAEIAKQSESGIFTKSELPDAHEPAPTPSLTKRITVMLPFRMFGNRGLTKEKDMSFPPRPLSPKIMEDEDDSRPFDFPPRPDETDQQTPMKLPFGGPTIPLLNRDDGSMPPFAPLPFLLLRSLLQPKESDIRNPISRPSSLPLPRQMNAGLPPRPLQNARLPPFHPQSQRGPPFGNTINYNNNNERREPSENDRYDNRNDRGHTIFAPSVTKTAQIKSSKHDNRHFNNITPNNKFTLLQVFVNKPHGPQQTSELNVPNESNPVPNRQISEPHQNNPIHTPFEQMARGQNPAVEYENRDNSYQPMYHSRPAFHNHLPPYHSRRFNNPFMPHFHPFGFPSFHNHAQHPQDNRRPFRRPDLPRVPKFDRPLVVVTDEDEEEDTSDDHYSCLLPLAPGKCKAFQTKWFYNRDTQKCEIFYFTGCGGNSNNFPTWEECAATCLDQPKGPRTTMPGTETEEPRQEELAGDDEDADERPDTIVFTSTVFPENEAEARQAQLDMESGATETPLSAEELRTTTDAPTEERDEVEESLNQSVVDDQVEKVPVTQSSEYIILMALVGVIGLAVILMVTISIVHLCRKMNASKKEKVLEAVLNHHLYGDIHKVVNNGTPGPIPVHKGTNQKA